MFDSTVPVRADVWGGPFAECFDADFLSRVYGREHRVFRGAPDRFSGVLDWRVMGTILACHRLDPLRMFLADQGRPVPARSYTRAHTDRRGKTRTRLEPERLYAALSSGATLVVNAVDELHPPAGALAAGLERLLKTGVQVNAYASWTAREGLGTHRDDHDVVVCQLHGSKRWRVYDPTEQWWIPVEAGGEPESAPTTPIDEFVLSAGDVLYLPRGFWHAVAASEGTASLHLTCGPNANTGIDLSRWLLDGLRRREAMRADLPRFRSPEEQSAYLEQWRQEILAELSDPDVLQRFFAERDAALPARLGLSLPHVDGVPADPALRVRLLAPLARLSRTGDDALVVAADGVELVLTSPGVEEALAPLLHGRTCSLAELAAAATLPVPQVAVLLTGLVARGIVELASPVSAEEAQLPAAERSGTSGPPAPAVAAKGLRRS
ncbi:cupin domain-containing protein [Streptomyces sp. NPDC002659]|uniref:cupin domain-containing protein n=1 Tax=Streptomyces sp. NPDC002659 TaxID=3364656 RepID=UPI00369A2DF4